MYYLQMNTGEITWMDNEITNVDESWGMSFPDEFPGDGDKVVFSTLDENTSGIMNLDSYIYYGFTLALCQHGGMSRFSISNIFLYFACCKFISYVVYSLSYFILTFCSIFTHPNFFAIEKFKTTFVFLLYLVKKCFETYHSARKS